MDTSPNPVCKVAEFHYVSEIPGWPHAPVDQAFNSELVTWLRFHQTILVGELVPEAPLRYLVENAASPRRGVFEHVLVDEYPDLNRAEQVLLDLLAEAGHLHRVERTGWGNVELVESDAADYAFPGNIGGVLSTFAMTMVDDYDGVIRRAAEALPPGGRLAILEMKRPEELPEWMVRFGAWFLRPFGVSPAYAERTPWESVRRHLDEVLYEEFYAGAIYLCVGQRRL